MIDQNPPNDQRKWWLSEHGQPVGPYDAAFIGDGLRTGRIRPDTYACLVGGKTWKRLNDSKTFAAVCPPSTGSGRQIATPLPPPAGRRSVQAGTMQPPVLPPRNAVALDLPRIVPLAVCTLGLGWGSLVFSTIASPPLLARGFAHGAGETVFAIFLLAAPSLVLATLSIFYFVRPVDLRSLRLDRFIQVPLFTATAGIVLLLLFQQLAEHEYATRLQVHGKAALYIAFFKFIGWCYASLDSPDVGKRFIGFIFGVGLCEEITKLLPLFYLGLKHGTGQDKNALTYRGFLLIGSFSGIGFGVGEALTYYSPWGQLHVYQVSLNVLRWFACVPAHAIWTTIAAAVLWYLLPSIKSVTNVTAKIALCALAAAIAAFLHGVYDALCGVGAIWGLVMTGLSIAILVWVVRAVAEACEDWADTPVDDRFASASAAKLLAKLETVKWIFPALYAASVLFILLTYGFSDPVDDVPGRHESVSSSANGQPAGSALPIGAERWDAPETAVCFAARLAPEVPCEVIATSGDMVFANRADFTTRSMSQRCKDCKPPTREAMDVAWRTNKRSRILETCWSVRRTKTLRGRFSSRCSWRRALQHPIGTPWSTAKRARQCHDGAAQTRSSAGIRIQVQV